MTTNMKKKVYGVAFLLLLLVFCTFSVHASSVNKRALYISSASLSEQSVIEQIEGIRGELSENVFLEYAFMNIMDAKSYNQKDTFYEWIKCRMNKKDSYNIIFLGDNDALEFALDHRDELFEGIPMIFTNVNDEKLLERARQEEGITGVVKPDSVDDTIAFMRGVLPDVKKIVAVVDDSESMIEIEHYHAASKKYPDLIFEEIRTNYLSPQIIFYKLNSLKSDTAVLFLSMHRDVDGTRYHEQQAYDILENALKVPAFCIDDLGMGQIFLGGSIVSVGTSGIIAADMANDVLSGIHVNKVREVTAQKVLMADYKVCNQYNVSLSSMPDTVKYVNHPRALFEENKIVFLHVMTVVIILVAVMIKLGMTNLKNKRLLTELEEARRIMEKASQHDFLTGIPNRNKFANDLTKLMDEQKKCTVFMIDIDDFKHINDSMGHSAGDEALVQVASRLKEMESNILTPYRFAGDEFILILESNQSKLVEKTAYQCRQIFSKKFVLDHQEYKISGSIGISTYPDDAGNFEQLIANADAAMYKVKKSGKNDFAFYESI